MFSDEDDASITMYERSNEGRFYRLNILDEEFYGSGDPMADGLEIEISADDDGFSNIFEDTYRSEEMG